MEYHALVVFGSHLEPFLYRLVVLALSSSNLPLVLASTEHPQQKLRSTMARPIVSLLGSEKKRKQEDEALHFPKRSRTSAMSSSGEAEFHDYALQLEENILQSRSNYNSIHTLLEFLQDSDGAKNEDTIAAVALCRVFSRLLGGGTLRKPRENSSSEATIAQWLREKLRDYEQALLRMLKNEDTDKQIIALTVVVQLVKEKAAHLCQSEDAIWQNGIFGQLVQTLIEEEVAEKTRTEFVEKYVERYDDVRYYTFACLAYVPSPP